MNKLTTIIGALALTAIASCAAPKKDRCAYVILLDQNYKPEKAYTFHLCPTGSVTKVSVSEQVPSEIEAIISKKITEDYQNH